MTLSKIKFSVLLFAAFAGPLQAQPGGELRLVRPIEVTQGIQSDSNSVPLLAGRTTWVRAHLATAGAVRGKIRGKLLFATPLASDTLESEGTLREVPAPQAGTRTILSFQVPSQMVVGGDAQLALLEVTQAETGVPLACRTCSTDSLVVAFGPPVELRLRIIGFRYQRDGEFYEPRAVDYQGVLSWLERAYPVSTIQSDTATMTAYIEVPECRPINLVLARVRALDLAGGQDPRTHYYGIVRDALATYNDDGAMEGCALGIPGTPDASIVSAGPVGKPSDTQQASWVKEATYGGHYAGHEIAHTLGRRHPGYCGQSADDAEHDTTAKGMIGGPSNTYAGIDPSDGQVYAGNWWHDVMSYCNPRWIGAPTYTAILQRLRAEDSLYSGQPPAPAGGYISGGTAAPGDSLLEVIAEFRRLETNEGRLLAAFTTWKRGRPAEVDSAAIEGSTSDHQAVVEVSYGTSVIRYPVMVMPTRGARRANEPSELLRGQGWVHAFVPSFPGEGWIRLLRAGVAVDSIYKSPSPTLLTSISHVVLADDAAVRGHRFAWTTDPIDAGSVVYVQASYDGGARWQVISRTRARQFSIACTLLRRRSSLRIRLLTADRVHTALAYESPELVPSAGNPCLATVPGAR